LRRRPGFAAISIVTLALGIGANAAIFSLLNTLLLRHLPVSEPEQLIQIGPLDRYIVSLPLFNQDDSCADILRITNSASN
jgi:hypothetical protein